MSRDSRQHFLESLAAMLIITAMVAAGMIVTAKLQQAGASFLKASIGGATAGVAVVCVLLSLIAGLTKGFRHLRRRP